MSSLFGCHSSLGVSAVIMSSFGNTLCGLPVHVAVCTRVLICQLLHTKFSVCVFVFFGMCTPENLCVRAIVSV